MAALPYQTRDAMMTSWRQRICATLGIIPYQHQAEWLAATDGLTLIPETIEAPHGTEVRLPDNSVIRYTLVPRPDGRARVVADLGAYKIGKSFGAALFAASFSCIRDARINLVGLEYDICAPEFDYICEFLLSERGMNLPYSSLQNRPRDGKMWLDLENGCRYEARSWERKDALKGKEIDAYVYCESYMLPGIECYTNFSQNLLRRKGYAIFATTPDRPWVKELHDRAHSGQPQYADWHCTCSVPASVNPSTFDAGAMDRDRDLMTTEKFKIHYLGQLGDFVGRVYAYQRGQRIFTSATHPDLFIEGHTNPNQMRIPSNWEIVCGADTGTFTSALIVAFSPDGEAFVIDEFPNYKYVSGDPELYPDLSIPTWAADLEFRIAKVGGRANLWADKNSQWKRELRNYGITLLASPLPFETRTEISREYFVHNKIYLAPWLSVLPFELENATWPEETSAAGKFARVKDRDHTLDCLEHILSQRPRGNVAPRAKTFMTWAESFVGKPFRSRQSVNPHLGAH